MVNNLANVITFTRVVGSVLFVFIPIESDLFYVIYTYCGISDILDGFIARKTKTTSEFGSKLDGASDLLFYSFMMYKIWPYLECYLPSYIWFMIWALVILRVINYIYIARTKKEFQSTHGVLNKATGLAMFFLPYVVRTRHFVKYSAITCLVALAAYIAEILPIFGTKKA